MMRAHLYIGQSLHWPMPFQGYQVLLTPGPQAQPWRFSSVQGQWQLRLQGPIAELCAQLQPCFDRIDIADDIDLPPADCRAIAALLKPGHGLHGRPATDSDWLGTGLLWCHDHWQQRLAQGPCAPTSDYKRWLWQPSSHPDSTTTVAVLGGGIAGAATARALAEVGFTVHLYERQSQPCQGASGNRQGVLYVKPSKGQATLARFQWQAWQFSCQLLQQADLSAEDYQAAGLLLLNADSNIADNPLYQGRYRVVDSAQASQLSGWPSQAPGLWLDGCPWVHPSAWAQQLLQHPRIHCHYQRPCRLRSQGSQWWVDDRGYQQVVLCTGIDSLDWPQLAHLKLQAIQGWVSHCALEPTQQGPTSIICAKGYVTPAVNGNLHFGASYGLNLRDACEQAPDQAHNLARLAELQPPFLPSAAQLSGRAGVRAATHDTLPLLGRVAAQPDVFGQELLRLKQDGRPPQWQPGLWLNTGHGSRGLSTAPLSAYIIACQLAGLPLPISPEVFWATQAERRGLKLAMRR